MAGADDHSDRLELVGELVERLGGRRGADHADVDGLVVAQQRAGLGGDPVRLLTPGGLEVIGRRGADPSVRHEPVERVNDGYDERGVKTDREDRSERERVAAPFRAVEPDDQRPVRLVPGHRKRA